MSTTNLPICRVSSQAKQKEAKGELDGRLSCKNQQAAFEPLWSALVDDNSLIDLVSGLWSLSGLSDLPSGSSVDLHCPSLVAPLPSGQALLPRHLDLLPAALPLPLKLDCDSHSHSHQHLRKASIDQPARIIHRRSTSQSIPQSIHHQQHLLQQVQTPRLWSRYPVHTPQPQAARSLRRLSLLVLVPSCSPSASVSLVVSHTILTTSQQRHSRQLSSTLANSTPSRPFDAAPRTTRTLDSQLATLNPRPSSSRP